MTNNIQNTLDEVVEREMKVLAIEISSILKQVRKEKKMTQVKLASLTGLPQKTISRIESGAIVPKIKTLLVIAYVLDLDIKILFNESNKRFENL